MTAVIKQATMLLVMAFVFADSASNIEASKGRMSPDSENKDLL